MSQLKNLNAINLNEGTSNSILDSKIEYIEEKAIYKMNDAQVNKKTLQITTNKRNLEEKLKWWNSLSDKEKQTEKNKAIILNLLLFCVVPLFISIPVWITRSKNHSVTVITDYETKLREMIAASDANLKMLEKRKTELSNSKKESSQLSLLNNLKTV